MSDFTLLGHWNPEAQDKVAIILACDEHGRIALQFRDNFPNVLLGGHWSLFGGHVEDGETPHQAAAREFYEEVGIKRPQSAYKPYLRLMSPSQTHVQQYVFRLTEPICVKDIRLQEGAGFAFIEPNQRHDFKLLKAADLILDHYVTVNSLAS